jgi:hypothetical protein
MPETTEKPLTVEGPVEKTAVEKIAEKITVAATPHAEKPEPMADTGMVGAPKTGFTFLAGVRARKCGKQGWSLESRPNFANRARTEAGGPILVLQGFYTDDAEADDWASTRLADECNPSDPAKAPSLRFHKLADLIPA